MLGPASASVRDLTIHGGGVTSSNWSEVYRKKVGGINSLKRGVEKSLWTRLLQCLSALSLLSAVNYAEAGQDGGGGTQTLPLYAEVGQVLGGWCDQLIAGCCCRR